MDLFIDKLAQKLSSNETIKPSTTTDTKEIEDLKAKIEEYENLLQEIKLVNLKNMESAEKLNSLAGECRETASTATDAASAAKKAVADLAEISKNEDAKEDTDLFEKTSDVIHRENVKVYRNIQASIQSSLEDQTKTIVDSQTEVSKKNSTTFLKVMSVLIFIAVLSDIALKVLTILGIL